MPQITKDGYQSTVSLWPDNLHTPPFTSPLFLPQLPPPCLMYPTVPPLGRCLLDFTQVSSTRWGCVLLSIRPYNVCPPNAKGSPTLERVNAQRERENPGQDIHQDYRLNPRWMISGQTPLPDGNYGRLSFTIKRHRVVKLSIIITGNKKY